MLLIAMGTGSSLLGTTGRSAASVLATTTTAPPLNGSTGLVLLDIFLDLAQHHLDLVGQNGLTLWSLFPDLLRGLFTVGVVSITTLASICLGSQETL